MWLLARFLCSPVSWEIPSLFWKPLKLSIYLSYQSLFCIVLDMAIEFQLEPLGNPWMFTQEFLQAKWLVLSQYKSNTILSKFNMEPKHGYIMLYSQLVIEKSFFRSKCLKVPCKPLVYSKKTVVFLTFKVVFHISSKLLGTKSGWGMESSWLMHMLAFLVTGAVPRGMLEKMWDHPTFRYPYHPISI
jgi:hypothetical protein